MEDLPPEIVHAICAYLTPNDAASVRLVNQKLADIAAYHVVARIRFHSSRESIKRLKWLSEHEVFSQTIKTVIFEGGVIANVGCVHAYNRHFTDEPHHAHDRPQAPPSHVSPREFRLYQRNKAKFQREVAQSYEKYRSLYDTQQELLDDPSFGQILGQSMSRFTQVTRIEYLTSRRCLHLLSSRFNDEFGGSCSVPMTADPLRSVTQVHHLIVPDGLVSNTLRSVTIENLSPRFFSGSIPGRSIEACFSNLTTLTLIMKLASDDIDEDDLGPDESVRRILSNNTLKPALAAAINLRYLTIGLTGAGVPEILLSSLFEEDAVWPDLMNLDVYNVCSTQTEFITMLKRQPRLKRLTLFSPILTSGKWVEVVRQMRQELDLSLFMLEGDLQDCTGSQSVDLINEKIYAEDFDEHTLWEAINSYVCSNDNRVEANPLEEPELYATQDYLYESYGYNPSELFDSDNDSMARDLSSNEGDNTDYGDVEASDGNGDDFADNSMRHAEEHDDIGNDNTNDKAGDSDSTSMPDLEDFASSDEMHE